MPAARSALPSHAAAVAAALLGLILAPAHAPSGTYALGASQAGSTSPPPEADIAAGEAAARTLCIGCHKLPPPHVLPKRMWRDQIARMWLILQNQPEPVAQGAAVRAVTFPDDWAAAARYYEAAAPEELTPPPPWPVPDRRLAFRRRAVAPPEGIVTRDPAISNVQLVDMTGNGRLELVAGDMRHGAIFVARPYEERPVLRRVADVPHPAHIQVVDFDGDGVLDLLVGDLGAFMPSDHDRGSVLWLRGRKDGTYAPMSLDGWPPVADVRAGDFDGDGRLDLAVAAFGWRRTGAFSILKNDTTDFERPGFIPRMVEQRTGAIHAVPVDLDRDGRLDIVVLFSQEHESVIAFLNRGGLQFERQVLYEAPHPAWGSSGIHVVDFNADGRLDVIVSNGDSFDGSVQKPYHGIVWLENRGSYPFRAHTIAKLGGVHRAAAVDLDGDGDLDIVASALVANQDEKAAGLPVLVWLERTDDGEFVPHTLATGVPSHATLDAGDIDGDGDIDIVVGNFSSGRLQEAWLEVWENLGKPR